MDNIQSQNNSPAETPQIKPPGGNYTPAAVMIGALIIAGAIVYSNRYDFDAGQAALPKAATEQARAQVSSDGHPFLGNPDAPVTLIEFSDFQCPFCGKFFRETEPKINEKYIKTGKVKFVYRDFAFLGEESFWAAQGARCAGDQGNFWQYHDYIFNSQNGENDGAFSKENLKKFAANLSLNASEFSACLDSEKYLAEVEKDNEDGRNAGVRGTPTVFINGRLISGALAFKVYEQVIEEELKAAK